MKRIFTLVLTALLCGNAFAQSAFMPGYFITEDGNRVDCLIKNTDRKYNPTTFEYMLADESVKKIAAIDTVQEFEILNTVHKYKRFRVNIDRSSNKVSTLSDFRNPDFKSEVLFLRVMVEGAASLFSYHEKDDLERFFFKQADTEVQQLVYKRYYVKDNDISTNEDYKNQLVFALVCGDVVPSKVKRLSYYGKDLADLFVTYNICVGSAYITMSEKKERGKLGLTVKAGINSSVLQTSQKIADGHSNYVLITHDFERLTTPVVSVEVEYVLPYRNRKWSIFTEPTYQQGKHEMQDFFFRYVGFIDGRRVLYPRREDIAINYTHISIPVGARYSYHLNNSSRVFVNAGVGFSALLSKSQIYEVGGFEAKREFRTIQHFAEPSGTVGLGFKYKNRVSIEGNYHVAKRVANSTGWQISYRDSFNAVLGFTIM